MTTPTPEEIAELRSMLTAAKRSRTGLGYDVTRINDLGFWLIGHGDALLALAERAPVAEARIAEVERANDEISRDICKLDAVVHALGIEDSEDDAAEAIKALQDELTALRARDAGWTMQIEEQAEEIARLRAALQICGASSKVAASVRHIANRALAGDKVVAVLDDLGLVPFTPPADPAQGRQGEEA